MEFGDFCEIAQHVWKTGNPIRIDLNYNVWKDVTGWKPLVGNWDTPVDIASDIEKALESCVDISVPSEFILMKNWDIETHDWCLSLVDVSSVKGVWKSCLNDRSVFNDW
jgi:hypothetical protein